MRRVMMIVGLSVAGCVEDASPRMPPPPGPEMQILIDQCRAGDKSMCDTVARIEALRAQTAAQVTAAPPRVTTKPTDPTPFLNTQPAPQPKPLATTTYCQPTIGGNIRCLTY